MESSWNENELSKGFSGFTTQRLYSKFYGAAAVGSAIVHIVVALKGRVLFSYVCVECVGGLVDTIGPMPWSQQPAPIPPLSPQQLRFH